MIRTVNIIIPEATIMPHSAQFSADDIPVVANVMQLELDLELATVRFPNGFLANIETLIQVLNKANDLAQGYNDRRRNWLNAQPNSMEVSTT